MTEQPVNLSTVIDLGVFSRAEQRVLQVIFKGIAEGDGSCAATLAMLASCGHRAIKLRMMNTSLRNIPSGGPN